MEKKGTVLIFVTGAGRLLGAWFVMLWWLLYDVTYVNLSFLILKMFCHVKFTFSPCGNAFD